MALSEHALDETKYMMTRYDMERWREPLLRRDIGSKLAHMGFFLEEFRMRQDAWHSGLMIEAIVVCPCGGVEGIRFALTGREPPERAADEVIVHFRHHIKTEVSQGTLSPAWLERL